MLPLPVFHATEIVLIAVVVGIAVIAAGLVIAEKWRDKRKPHSGKIDYDDISHQRETFAAFLETYVAGHLNKLSLARRLLRVRTVGEFRIASVNGREVSQKYWRLAESRHAEEMTHMPVEGSLPLPWIIISKDQYRRAGLRDTDDAQMEAGRQSVSYFREQEDKIVLQFLIEASTAHQQPLVFSQIDPYLMDHAFSKIESTGAAVSHIILHGGRMKEIAKLPGFKRATLSEVRMTGFHGTLDGAFVVHTPNCPPDTILFIAAPLPGCVFFPTPTMACPINDPTDAPFAVGANIVEELSAYIHKPEYIVVAKWKDTVDYWKEVLESLEKQQMSRHWNTQSKVGSSGEAVENGTESTASSVIACEIDPDHLTKLKAVSQELFNKPSLL